MIELRLRTKVGQSELDTKVGKVLTPDDFNLLLTRDALVRKPDGSPLVIYRRGAIPAEEREVAYPILHELRRFHTENRGLASGSKRKSQRDGVRTNAKRVASTLVGAFDPQGPRRYCRLTAWTGREYEKLDAINPFLRTIGDEFHRLVADRWRAQMMEVSATDPHWIIPGTPFSTLTVNNTYPTGVHKDQGDLPTGFSTLTCLRRGDYQGGHLVFPEYRVAIDMRDGDLLLMDAHEWHGNTFLECRCGTEPNGPCETCGAERISVVAYYRTRIKDCGSAEDEEAKQRVYAEEKNRIALGDE